MENKVLFLVHPEANDEVFAYWPDVEASPGFKMCYSRIGQHGSASLEYARESRKATTEEYEELENELLAIGYELEIVN